MMSAQLKLQTTPKIDCSPEEWQARVDLACCYRVVAHMGWHHSLIYNPAAWPCACRPRR
jgi:hypothetical protein